MGKKAEQAEATRTRLIEIAAELFASRGYDETSLEDILSAAAVSKGALYHHFTSKEALFEAVYEWGEQIVLQRIRDAALAEEDELDGLRAGMVAWLDIVAREDDVRRISLIDAPRVLGWDRQRRINERYAFGLTRQGLERAMAAGRMDAQPLDMMAHIVLAALCEAAMLIARADDHEEAREQAIALLDRLLSALAREPHPARA